MMRSSLGRMLPLALLVVLAGGGVSRAADEIFRISLGSERDSAAQERIDKALDKEVDFQFEDAPLKDVAAFFRDVLEVSVQVDERSLEAAGIAGDSAITCKVSKISARAALRLALKKLDASFVIRDESLTITSRDDAGRMLEVHVYPVRDLVAVKAEDGSSSDDYEALIAAIQSTIAAPSWDASGGSATIKPLPTAGSLVISQTSEVQSQIEKLLNALRKSSELAANR